MPTPRSESIYKALQGETEIRPPQTPYDVENKIDHFAVLSQVINHGVRMYIDHPPAETELATATSLDSLSGMLRGEVSDAILEALHSDTFAAHHKSLSESQNLRHTMNEGRWRDISMNILAGSTTFVSSFSYIFSMLMRHLGSDVAAHPDNWRIADRVAKLEIHQFSAYYTTYLATFQNWSAMMEHFEISSTNSVQFKNGYPANAPVPAVVAAGRARILETKDFMLDGSQPLVLVKDIETSGAIGCPVTFSPEIIRDLWKLYATEAYRVVTTPPIANSGDIAASIS
ncbi:MAG TPA: hypothetical protein VN081_05490 [Dongiaceae bacterium]|nr:hypothetical protein [Dongiaceae bacterium]